MGDFSNSVYDFVKLIPRGKVVSYGDVARAIGAPRASRQVGWVLHVNPYRGIVPCHRVLFKDGRLCSGFAFGGIGEQSRLLQEEGVEVSSENKVDMQKFRWEI